MARVTFTGPAVTTINQNLDVKASVRVATTAAIATYTRTGNVITASGNGAIAAVDGVTLIAADRLLLKDGAAGADNGIYAVTTVGTGSTPFVLTRTTDADASSKVTTGMFTFVEEGTVNASTGWILTTANPITLNTTALTFTQFTGVGEITAGAGISKTGNTLSVAAAQTSITSITASTGATLTLATLDGNKNVVIAPHGTGQIEGALGSATAPSWTFTGDLDTGMYHAGANQIGFAVNAGKMVGFDTSGINCYDGSGHLGGTIIGINNGGITMGNLGTGSVTITSLAGSGSRTVVADANGKLSAP
jgi:hypothetical protein